MKITGQFLVEKSACADGLEWFKKNFPEGGEYQAVLDALGNTNQEAWASWLLNKAGRTNEITEIQGDLIVEHGFYVTGFLKVTGKIVAKFLGAGSGIKAGEGIEAGWGIKAGSGIEAGEGIEAGSGIEAGWGIKAGNDFAIYAGLRLRISDKKKFAIVVAKTKPKNLLLGTYVKPKKATKKKRS